MNKFHKIAVERAAGPVAEVDKVRHVVGFRVNVPFAAFEEPELILTRRLIIGGFINRQHRFVIPRRLIVEPRVFAIESRKGHGRGVVVAGDGGHGLAQNVGRTFPLRFHLHFLQGNRGEPQPDGEWGAPDAVERQGLRDIADRRNDQLAGILTGRNFKDEGPLFVGDRADIFAVYQQAGKRDRLSFIVAENNARNRSDTGLGTEAGAIEGGP